MFFTKFAARKLPSGQAFFPAWRRQSDRIVHLRQEALWQSLLPMASENARVPNA